MRILCAFSKYNYGDVSLGLGIEYVAFLGALKRMGHRVLHLDTGDKYAYPTPAPLNQALLNAVLEEKPDVLLTVQKDCEIWIETLCAIRAWSPTKTITWATDDSFKFRKVSQFIARHYDLITTTYDYCVEAYHGKGIYNVALTQWAANSQWLQPPLPASACEYDVTFVGINYGARGELIERLRAEGIAVECFGRGWPNGTIATEELPLIFRNSRISLNFSEASQGRGAHPTQLKARTFEVPGAGGFLLTQDTPGLANYYIAGKEIATFHTAAEMVAKVLHYQKNPGERDAIAGAGFLRTRNEHTYEQRFQLILQMAEKLPDKPKSPSDAPRDLAEAERRFRAMSPVLRALRWCLVRTGTAIWGEDRGIKAARRLTFEASWRLAGERTFTAAGLPGRLFP